MASRVKYLALAPTRRYAALPSFLDLALAATRRYAALPPLLALISCGGETFSGGPGESTPLLTLVQTATDTVELKIAGPEGLRALQARLSWDTTRFKISKVALGKAAARLDRLFYGDLSSGSAVVGLSDTRRVRLPARGALLRLTVARAGGAAGSSTLKVVSPLGADEGGARVELSDTSLEVRLP